MTIVPVPCLKDNYAYLLIARSGDAVVVDASEAAPVREALRRHRASLRAVWSTHHHWDHVGGNEELAASGRIEIVGPASDRGRLPAMSRGVCAGDRLAVGELAARCLHVPGHTLGATAYLVESDGAAAVFTGDTLFCAGCGRLFEGTAEQMHGSLALLAHLAPETRVYCGHEYTLQNLRFAAAVEPDNPAVAAASERARSLASRGQPTIGTTMADERAVNPFLRLTSTSIRQALGLSTQASEVETFAALRRAKDVFGSGPRGSL